MSGLFPSGGQSIRLQIRESGEGSNFRTLWVFPPGSEDPLAFNLSRHSYRSCGLKGSDLNCGYLFPPHFHHPSCG